MLVFLRTKQLLSTQRLPTRSDLFSIGVLHILQNPPSISPPTHKLYYYYYYSSKASENGSTQERKQEKSELVKNLLKNCGFNETHISRLSRVSPLIFAVDPQKILLPKIEFFRSIGVSDADLRKILTVHGVLLTSSLEKKLIPNYNFLRDFLLSDEQALKCFTRCPRILSCNMPRIIYPNIELLRQLGVPSNFLTYMLRYSADALFRDHNKFKGFVDEVMKMGFDPKKKVFVDAVKVFCKKPKRILDQKMEVYRRFGFSDEEVWALFRSRPNCMEHSEEKIVGMMEFLSNKMKLSPTAVVKCPAALSLDLKRRVVPRCRVIQLLIDKNLVSKSLSISSFLLIAEDKFLNKFVANYEKKLPGLLKIYQG